MKKRKRANFSVSTVTVSCLLALGGIWIADTFFRLFRKPEPAVFIDERYSETESVPETSENLFIQKENLALGIFPSGYTAERKKEQDVHKGLLLQTDFPFSGNPELISFQNKNSYYHLKSDTLLIQEPALRAVNALAEAYFQETGQSNLLIYSTTEPDTSENALYSDIFPDRSTGFCLDLAFLNEDGTFSPFSRSDWIEKNACRFGFIQPVPEADYHFRFIGKLHACLMAEHHFTFEEYLHFLRNYSVFSPYRCSFNHQEIIIYFMPSAVYGSTDIPVPENKGFEISGNNTDGFIVWTTADKPA